MKHEKYSNNSAKKYITKSVSDILLDFLVEKKVDKVFVLTGGAIAFAAILLIIPGFATDVLGFLLIFPFTRKLILGKISKKFRNNKTSKTFIDGEFEDIKDDDERKL